MKANWSSSDYDDGDGDGGDDDDDGDKNYYGDDYDDGDDGDDDVQEMSLRRLPTGKPLSFNHLPQIPP